ncbi:uncharacterized protein LOC144623110 isoform X1 [Crassostrea virginica]
MAVTMILFYLGFLKYFTECAYENVALNKPAFQQNPYIFSVLSINTTHAGNAVDGLKTDLRGIQGQCSLSENNKTTALWWVNLTRMFYIHDIKIYYRTDNEAWGSGYAGRFLGFSLYVSNTTERSEDTLCFKDTSFTINTIPPVFTTTCPVRGQYVIIYNERLPSETYPNGYSKYAFIDLCEVEVYACPDGFFGPQCVNKCNSTCYGCNIISGSCENGCLPGWKGNYCHEKCRNNTYGTECSLHCEHCRGSQPCHHTNGSCMNGCADGFKGEICSERCDFGYYGFECKDQCSSFCKTSRDCDHVTGFCIDGCKSGWQGNDCLEVSKVADCEKTWKSEFQGVLGIFCITLIITCVQTAYIIFTRVKNTRQKEAERIRCIKSNKNIPGDLEVTVDHGSLERKYDGLAMSKDVETYDVAY